MIKKIVQATDPVLRKVSKPITSFDKKALSLIKDLKDTIIVQIDPEGVGLAACQIGKNFRVFVMKYKKSYKVVVNPEIIVTSGQEKLALRGGTKIMEGCLSLPNLYSPLKRSSEITIKYLSEDGKEMTETFKGFEAQIVQHELDHLDGKLFIDRLVSQDVPLYEHKDGEWERIELI